MCGSRDSCNVDLMMDVIICSKLNALSLNCMFVSNKMFVCIIAAIYILMAVQQL